MIFFVVQDFVGSTTSSIDVGSGGKVGVATEAEEASGAAAGVSAKGVATTGVATAGVVALAAVDGEAAAAAIASSRFLRFSSSNADSACTFTAAAFSLSDLNAAIVAYGCLLFGSR